MNKMIFGLFLFYLLTSWAFAQDADQSSSDPGVLVSSPAHDQAQDQGNIGNDGGDDAANVPAGHHKHQHPDSDADASGQDTASNNNDNGGGASTPTDEIVVKSTDAIMQQITANMKLTPEQIDAVHQIIEDNVAKTRDLQLSMQNGNIDSKTMYDQRQQLTSEENQKLGQIFSSDQMKVWLNIQNPE